MTAIQLYKFVTENGLEFKWERNDNDWDVVLFLYTFQIDEFNKLLPNTVYDDEGVECTMKDGYLAFWMSRICSHCGIELEEIFGENDRKND